MKIFNKIFFILLLFCLQEESRYERHNQFCGGLNGSDIKWLLAVRENKTYSLQITERRNEYLSRPKTTFLVGTWELIADTLKLSDWAKKGEILFFYKSGNKLIFQGNKSKIQSRSLIYLDYLEQSRIEQ